MPSRELDTVASSQTARIWDTTTGKQIGWQLEQLPNGQWQGRSGRTARGDHPCGVGPFRVIAVDTGPLVATLDADDANHEPCLELLERQPWRVDGPAPVLTEVGVRSRWQSHRL